jgi:lysophospholipase L1-like esterase
MMLRRVFVCAFVILCGVVAGRADAAVGACQSASCVNVVFDGDSISAGSGATPHRGLDVRVVAGLGDDVVLHNVAAGGRPVHECLRLYPELVAPLHSAVSRHNVIVFHAGDNDIAQGRTAAETYAAFTDYVAAAHRQGWKVVVSTELRQPLFPPAKEEALEDYNRQLLRNTAGADAVVDLDAEHRFTDLSYRNDRAVFHDSLHPSDGGYDVLAGMLTPVVKRVAGR